MAINISKHVRHYPSKEDGVRLLVMRWWPRGVKKETFDSWLSVLAPSVRLLKAYKSGELFDANLNPVQNTEEQKFEIFRPLYVEEMNSIEAKLCIRGLAQEVSSGTVLTLLCGCHDPALCHRSILRELIIEAERGL